MSDVTHPIPKLDRKGLRSFGLTTGAIVAVLFGVIFPWLLKMGTVLWPWVLFSVLVLLALHAPMTLGPVYRVWMRFGLLMSRFTTPLIMTLVFFLVITPTALVIKLFHKDAMNRSLSKSQPSYRVASSVRARESLERPY